MLPVVAENQSRLRRMEIFKRPHHPPIRCLLGSSARPCHARSLDKFHRGFHQLRRKGNICHRSAMGSGEIKNVSRVIAVDALSLKNGEYSASEASPAGLLAAQRPPFSIK